MLVPFAFTSGSGIRYFTDPSLALAIYAAAMRRDDGENQRLRALVEGSDLGGLVTSDHSEAPAKANSHDARLPESRSTSGV